MTRPRAADDFDMIYQRVKELRRQSDALAPGEGGQPVRAEAPMSDRERRVRDRREGLPPPWVPTIFYQKANQYRDRLPSLARPLRVVIAHFFGRQRR